MGSRAELSRMRPEVAPKRLPRQGEFLEAATHRRLVESLGIERNVAAVSGAVFLVGLGEEIWKKFLPKYLESLGASVAVVGLFGTSEDLLDALYQYPGGWLADHWGRRRAFLIFLGAALTGYLVYLLSPSWPFLFLRWRGSQWHRLPFSQPSVTRFPRSGARWASLSNRC